MRKLFLILLFVSAGTAASFAQTADEEIKLIQEAFGKDKKALITE